MTRTRYYIAALLLGCGLFFVGSSAAEARPIVVRPAIRGVYVAPHIGVARAYYPGHFRGYYYGRRWYR